MTELTLGDVCICDLSRSLNSPKDSRAPLVFLGTDETEGGKVWRFCRIGSEPKAWARTPYIAFHGEAALRNDGAIFPTQYVLFPVGYGIIRMLGSIQNEDTLQFIRATERKHARKEVALIMNLCPRCREDFMTDPKTVVKRLNAYSPVKSTCDFCQVRQGHLFVVYKRKTYRNGVSK